MIAQAWFKIVDRVAKKHSLAKLQASLAGKTLVGEYVGNYHLQHIVKYSKETIIFYAVTENSDEKNCLLPEESYAIFNEFGLDCVPCDRVGLFDNINSLSDALYNEYNIVASGSIRDEEEGAVLYMIKRGQNDDKVLSLAKLKSLEYRIFRKLREKLRNFWAKHENIQQWTPNHQAMYDKLFATYLKECKDLTGETPLPQTPAYYRDFAYNAFEVVKQDYTLYQKLSYYYIDFLEEITYAFNMDTSMFTSKVFKNTKSKTYPKLKTENLRPDNKSWQKRSINKSYYTDVPTSPTKKPTLQKKGSKQSSKQSLK